MMIIITSKIFKKSVGIPRLVGIPKSKIFKENTTKLSSLNV